MKVRILHLLANMQLKAVSAVFVFGMCHIVP